MEKIKYKDYEKQLPQSGEYILGQRNGESVYVYQAYNHAIANFAVENQKFGGRKFSFKRMTWIKPNFLWMMFRSGWASKENQERILAIEIPLAYFKELYDKGVYSSFREDKYDSFETWKELVAQSEVRLQWDPDHDPYGEKIERRAIQLGIRGDELLAFNSKIISITDLTDFVIEQREVMQNDFKALQVIKEEVLL
ncbi:DUF4291 domain-containing protein [Aureibacter tunicatorum]|uniref:DUF4291 domain-containing protein n=1 Tax=Aureibacter tunicatorum TaxID=866807 RepID=A0AAE4BUE2_9BACT|nr:DUF4291 domain-containing protein [Aureibacter tunicatorum]MDR6240673.1 hypothetical protein [Aureibacter tunicatorum]BDD06994.1 hypothetical protein AUTU_44770 [Aureibacter tunicatorum]